MHQETFFTTRADTIESEKFVFRQKLHTKGEAFCPCCERHAQVSKQRVHSTVAFMLCRLYRVAMANGDGNPDDWCHIESFRPEKHGSGRDFSIVKHWGLAEPMPADYAEDKRSSGMWRLTPLGIEFVLKRAVIAEFIMIFDNSVMTRSDSTVDIEKCLNDKFSYFDSTGIGGV